MNHYLEGALITWYLLTACSMVFLIWDLLTNTPAGNVMKLAWVLVVFYTGPIGLFIYLLSCRQPLPGTHDEYIKPLWKQATGSLLHCVAGDATGIILSAVIVYHFGLPNGIDLTIEYLSAFVVGLFIFQALFMLSMYGNYWKAVSKTIFVEDRFNEYGHGRYDTYDGDSDAHIAWLRRPDSGSVLGCHVVSYHGRDDHRFPHQLLDGEARIKTRHDDSDS